MKDVQTPALDDEAGEGAAHALEVFVLHAFAVEPVIDRFQGPRRRLARRQEIRLAEIVVDEGAHGQFGGDAPALHAADPIGQGGDGAVVAALFVDAQGGEVLVVVALAGLAGEAGGDVQAHIGVGWRAHDQVLPEYCERVYGPCLP